MAVHFLSKALLALPIFLAGVTPAKSPEAFVGPAPAVVAPSPAAPAANPPAAPAPSNALDTAKIHAAYLEGDFDQATHGLEAHLKTRLPMSHAESVFVYKHLGVMYAANQKTRDKGKYYMYQLIEIEPTARILDMYASDMIHLIFRNVQEDYEMRHKTVAVQQPSQPAPAPPQPSEARPAQAKTSRDRKAMYYWAAGGAAAVAATLAVVFFLNSGETTKTRTITVTP